MRKNVLALILLLPLLFLLVLFSSAKTVSLGVPVSAGGIEILGKPEDGVYRIDLSTYRNEYSVAARVTPMQASNRGYFLKVEGDAVSVDEDGVIRAERPGQARVRAISKEGGFEDSVGAVVYASRPLDFSLSLAPLGETLKESGETFSGVTGRYSYFIKALPEGVPDDVQIEVERGFCEIDRPSSQLFFPFSGETVLNVSMRAQRGGEEARVEKRITLTLAPPEEKAILINGGNPVLALGRDVEEASFYVEGERPNLAASPYIAESFVEELGQRRYLVRVRFSERKYDFSLALEAGGNRETVYFRFSDFDFYLRSELAERDEKVYLALGEAASFFAVPSTAAQGVEYVWSAPDGLVLEQVGTGAECRVTSSETGEYELSVRAERGGVPLDVFEKKLSLRVITRVSAVQLAFEQGGLAKSIVLAGERNGAAAEYPVPVLCYGADGTRTEGEIELSSSDESVARIENGALVPVSTGRTTVSAKWPGNFSYGTDVGAQTEIFIVKDGVEVSSSPQLYAAARAGKKIVLSSDVLLGTDERGEPLPENDRRELFTKLRSTFNTEYYRNLGKEAEIFAAIEFRADVYGNGHTINAELLSAAKDGAGKPLFFRGPLDFVRFGSLASVAAQDNICFLVRTDGIKLYHVNLLGCGDERLTGGEGYDLSALNTVGTVLELNASVKVMNCRVRNGRTAVRVYGGNREGDRYFSERQSAESEKIVVTLEGCILSQAREFLLKVGANAAVQADLSAEPDLLGADGNPLAAQTNRYLDDEKFRERYVLTDVTLKDSVLETSGLFTIGVESNFAGELLRAGAPAANGFEGWQGTGGTSYASVLRLKGDVKLYDWKKLALVDSSTLIQSELPEFKLDLSAMLEYAAQKDPEAYGGILDEGFVHGGIAFYGGGKNYSQLDLRELNGAEDLKEYRVNLSILRGAEGSTGYLGGILPSAAGTQDFRFYLYAREGRNSREEHARETERGDRYAAIAPLSPFD